MVSRALLKKILAPLRVTLLIATVMATGLVFLWLALPSLINSSHIKQKALDLLPPALARSITIDHIRPRLLPRPGFRFQGVTLSPGKGGPGVHAETVDLFPDAEFLFSWKTASLSGNLVLRQLEYIQGDLPSGFPAAVGRAALKKLGVRFSHADPKTLSINLDGHGLHLTDAQKRHSVSTAHIKARIVRSPGGISACIDPVRFNAPPMTLGMTFYRDTKTKVSRLGITGKNIDVDSLATRAAVYLGDNRISRTLFHIVKGGHINTLTIDFNSEKFLFDPREMVIAATLEKGIVAIPHTPLTARQVAAQVVVKKGHLLPRISGGEVAGARLKRGTLDVDLLDRAHSFKGTFDLTAALDRLPWVLENLLPRTGLARELKNTRDIKGNATGTLILDRQNKGPMTVSVTCKAIDITGRYQRFPGEHFSLTANGFQTDGRTAVSLSDLSGTIGPMTITRLSGQCGLGAAPRLSLNWQEGKGDVQKILAWLGRFKASATVMAPYEKSQGTVTLGSGTLSGPFFQPRQWQYTLKGTCTDGTLSHAGSKEPLLTRIRTEFTFSPDRMVLQDAEARIHAIPGFIRDTTWFKSCKKTALLLEDLRFPVALTKGQLKKKRDFFSFNGSFATPLGPQVIVDVSEKQDAGHQKDGITRHALTLVDPPRSHATLTWSGKPPLAFSGILDLETVKSLFRPGSQTADMLAIEGLQGDILLKSTPDQGLHLHLERLTATTDLPVRDHGEAAQGNTLPNESTSPQGKEMVLPPVTALPMLSRSCPRKSVENLLSFLPRPLLVHMDALEINNRTVSDIALELVPSPSHILVNITEAKLCHLPFTGQIGMDDQGISIRLSTHGYNQELSSTLECLTGSRDLISGKCDPDRHPCITGAGRAPIVSDHNRCTQARFTRPVSIQRSI